MRRSLPPLALACLLVMTSCMSSGPGQGASSAPARLHVAASIYPLAFLAERIGGDLLDLTQITPGGVEPHEYEPVPLELAAVSDARVVLVNGGGIDTWSDTFVAGSGKTLLKMTDKIPTLSGLPHEHEEDGEEHEEEVTASGTVVDPHLWLSPATMLQETVVIRDALIAADPAHAGVYTKNASMLQSQLKTLDAEFKAGLKTCSKKEIVVSHDAFGYLSHDYGFETLAVSGLSPEADPSPRRIAELSDLAKEKGVTHIFFETLTSPALAETIASEIGAEVLVLNPLEGLTEDDRSKNKTYFSIMRDNLANLRIALQCT